MLVLISCQFRKPRVSFCTRWNKSYSYYRLTGAFFTSLGFLSSHFWYLIITFYLFIEDVGYVPLLCLVSLTGLVQRCVIIQKDENGFGLTVSGDNPVFVQLVKEGEANKVRRRHSGTDCRLLSICRLYSCAAKISNPRFIFLWDISLSVTQCTDSHQKTACAAPNFSS